MKIHHLRNATCIIEAGSQWILVDPMLSEQGALPPFSVMRHHARRNPTVPLPPNAPQLLENVTHCLITHSHTFGLKALQHTDHLDTPGEALLRRRSIPVACRVGDAEYLRKQGLQIATILEYWQPKPFLGGEITAIPAQHGRGWIHKIMANGAGFYLRLPGEPSLYISGDTVWTADVERALKELKPDIAVVAAGSASVDVGGPILMPLEDIITFVQNAPKRVLANHLDALNHSPTTRAQLKQELEKRGLLSKTIIPQDGESVSI